MYGKELFKPLQSKAMANYLYPFFTKEYIMWSMPLARANRLKNGAV